MSPGGLELGWCIQVGDGAAGVVAVAAVASVVCWRWEIEELRSILVRF